jgi:hypothetical protein
VVIATSLPTPTPAAAPTAMPQPTPLSLDLAASGGDLADDALGLTIDVPAEALAGSSATLVVDQLALAELPAPVGGIVFGEHAFSVGLSSSAATALPAPLSLTYQPTPGELAAVGGDPNRLRIGLLTDTLWVPLPCTVDPVTSALVCSASQPGQFAVLVGPGITTPPDTDIANGRFYAEANGFSGASSTGYSIVDNDSAAMWTAFQQLGGVAELGYPVSGRFQYKGFVTQAFQRSALQWRPELGTAVPVNVFDDLSLHGSDAWLQRTYQVPTSPGGDDAAMSWDDVLALHMALLEAYPALSEFYANQPQALDTYGLPVSVGEYGSMVVVRLQRGMLQLWTVDGPWGPAGTVVAGNAGDMAKEVGLWPTAALAPEAAPQVTSAEDESP